MKFEWIMIDGHAKETYLQSPGREVTYALNMPAGVVLRHTWSEYMNDAKQIAESMVFVPEVWWHEGEMKSWTEIDSGIDPIKNSARKPHR